MSQLLVTRLESDLETERERVRQQREREEELRLKVLSLEGQVTHKQQEVERLERMLELVKQEASAQMHDRVSVFLMTVFGLGWPLVRTALYQQ